MPQLSRSLYLDSDLSICVVGTGSAFGIQNRRGAGRREVVKRDQQASTRFAFCVKAAQNVPSHEKRSTNGASKRICLSTMPSRPGPAITGLENLRKVMALSEFDRAVRPSY